MSAKIENISFSVIGTSQYDAPQEGTNTIVKKVMDKLAEICVGSEYNSTEHKLTYYGHEITCVCEYDNPHINLILKIKNISDAAVTGIKMTGKFNVVTVQDEGSKSFIWNYNTRMTLLTDNDNFFVNFDSSEYNLFSPAKLFGNCKVGENNYLCYPNERSQAILCDQAGNRVYITDYHGLHDYMAYVVLADNQMDAGKIVYIDALLFDMNNIVAGVSTHNIISITATGISNNTFINVNGKVYYILSGSGTKWIGLCAGDAE